MLWQALTAVRDLDRLHDIASVLIRYGFGDMVRRMGLANALERTGRALRWNEADQLAHLPSTGRILSSSRHWDTSVSWNSAAPRRSSGSATNTQSGS